MAIDLQKVTALSQTASAAPEGYNGVGEAREPNCSDVMTIYLTVNPRRMVVDSGFVLTEGACATVRAAAAAAVLLARDKPVMAAYTIAAADIARELSDDGTVEKQYQHCMQMAELALKRAVVDYSNQK